MKNGAARVALAGIFLVAHFTLRPLLLEWPVAPSLLLGGLLLASLGLRAGVAAGVGFLLGVLEASVALTGLGVVPALLTGVGYLGARSRDLLWADTRPFIFVFLALGTWVSVLALGVALGASGAGPLTLAVRAAVSAVLTALVCGTADRIVAGGRP